MSGVADPDDRSRVRRKWTCRDCGYATTTTPPTASVSTCPRCRGDFTFQEVTSVTDADARRSARSADAAVVALESSTSIPAAPSLSLRSLRDMNVSRCQRWNENDDAWTGADWATALGGECGEALNVVKKLRRVEALGQPGKFDPPQEELRRMLADECADVLLYLDLLADHYGIDLAAATVAKFNTTSERYGFPERLALDADAERGQG